MRMRGAYTTHQHGAAALPQRLARGDLFVQLRISAQVCNCRNTLRYNDGAAPFLDLVTTNYILKFDQEQQTTKKSAVFATPYFIYFFCFSKVKRGRTF